MVNSITGPAQIRDRDWYYEPGHDWYRENLRPEPKRTLDPDEIDDSENASNSTKGKSKNSDWSVASGRKKKKRLIERGNNMRPIDIKHLANLTDYAQIFSKLEQPEWRKKLLRKYGPLGIEKTGYTDFSKVFLWEWSERELGKFNHITLETKTFY